MSWNCLPASRASWRITGCTRLLGEVVQEHLHPRTLLSATRDLGRRPFARKISVASGLSAQCIRPIYGARLLAIMEPARRWSIKWVEFEEGAIGLGIFVSRVLPDGRKTCCVRS